MEKVQTDLRFYTLYRHPVTLEPFYVGKAVSEGTKLAIVCPVVRKKISDAAIGRACPEITKEKLSKHFSAVRKGAGNPAAKTWKVTNPDGVETIVENLRGFCEQYEPSYVGLKAAYHGNRKVQKGKSCGWALSLPQ